jgi:hypothetical protein
MARIYWTGAVIKVGGATIGRQGSKARAEKGTAREETMAGMQFYLSIGIPSLLLALGMIGDGLLFNGLSARMSSLEARMLALETRVNTRFDLIMGRLSDLDTGLSVLQDRSKR